MKNNLKRIFASILTAVMVFTMVQFLSLEGFAMGFADHVVSANTSERTMGIHTARWSNRRLSYIYKEEDNIIIVNARDSITVTTYESSFRKLSEKEIQLELPVFGGFYNGEAYNYIVFGQNNTEESAEKEVYRIVKYDKNFKKISQASIKGSQCIATIPFDAGTVAMAESGNELTVHTSRERFTSDDGLNHQSQFTIVLNTDTMLPTNYLTKYQTNHVSHSFNQFVKYDDGVRVLVDHGDAYPRSVLLSKFSGTPAYERYTTLEMFKIPGETGANCTGVYVGDFEISKNNYIVGINTIDHSKVTEYNSFSMIGLGTDQRDVVLLISDKNNTSSQGVNKVYLTDYVKSNLHGTAPYIVKLTDEWFAVLWKEYRIDRSISGSVKYENCVANGIKYVIVDENGKKLSAINTLDSSVDFSDCRPIYFDNKIVWYYDFNKTERHICTLDLREHLMKIPHEHNIMSVSEKASTCTVQGNSKHYRCKDCGQCYKDPTGIIITTAEKELLPFEPHAGGTATCTKQAECSRCATPYGALKEHTFKKFTKNSTCTVKGYEYDECTVCNGIFNRKELPLLEHSWNEWNVTIEPTFTSTGVKTRECTVCGNTETAKVPQKTLNSYITVLSSIVNTVDGPKLTWEALEGANGYYVYRRTSGTSWTRLGTTVSTVYTDKTAKSGTTYIYTAKAYNSSSTSKFQNGLTIEYLTAPTVSSVSNTTAGANIKWNKITGASKYNVYRKTANSTYIKIGDTTGTSFTDKNASSGTKYYYTVRAVCETTSSSYRAGTGLVYLTAPTVSSVSNTTAGVKVVWGKVTGASGYYVYRKTAKGSYSRIGTTTAASFTDKTAKSGTTYYYTVRAYKCTTLSSYNAGKGIKFLTSPTISSVVNTTAGAKAVWGKVTGASGYYVYRKTANGSYSRVGTTTATSFTDKTAKKGTTYYYTVRAYSGKTLSSYKAGTRLTKR